MQVRCGHEGSTPTRILILGCEIFMVAWREQAEIRAFQALFSGILLNPRRPRPNAGVYVTVSVMTIQPCRYHPYPLFTFVEDGFSAVQIAPAGRPEIGVSRARGL
ncbi:MAG: hypothetical protein BZY80_00735 [SAR202 cluster bacterium Io17-Chloro-G2]|nr:MAG: hypothetical protein BZY80_00735 [SAR202 cluster bacterium Io17-Chloro-G2]